MNILSKIKSVFFPEKRNIYMGDMTDTTSTSSADTKTPMFTDAQANAEAASSAETSTINDAIQARLAGINANVGRARAGMLGDSSANTNTSSVYNNAYQNSVQNYGATQADYLNKMGQVEALSQCAQNMKSGALLNAFAASLSGAAGGASLGSSLGGGK